SVRSFPQAEYPLRRRHCMQRTSTFGLLLLLALGTGAFAQAIRGREAIPVADDYCGTKMADSYRWLEDATSVETRAFIDAENAYTTRYLKQAHIRSDVVDDLDALENITDTRAPRERADSYFFERRVAGEQQFS